MATKVCKRCKLIFDGVARCPQCGSEETTDNFKGRVVVLKPEQSEIAKNLQLKQKGSFAVKLG